MKISETEVRYIAGLANLNLSEDEIHSLRGDLDEILTHIDKLNELDLSGVEPMSQVLYEAAETDTLRADVERATLGSETAVENAAASGGGYYKVPKVIER